MKNIIELAVAVVFVATVLGLALLIAFLLSYAVCRILKPLLFACLIVVMVTGCCPFLTKMGLGDGCGNSGKVPHATNYNEIYNSK